MALTPAQRAFITRFLGVPLPGDATAGGQGPRTPGETISPAADALIDPLRPSQADDVAAEPSGEYVDAAYLMAELTALVVPDGATAAEAAAMQAERDTIYAATQGTTSQTELRLAAGALQRLIGLREACESRLAALSANAASLVASAEKDRSTADPEIGDEVARELDAALDAVRLSLAPPLDEQKIGAAGAAAAALREAVANANSAAKAERDRRATAGKALRDGLAAPPDGLSADERRELEDLRNAILALLPDTPSDKALEEASNLASDFVKRVEAIKSAIADRARRAASGNDLRKSLAAAQPPDRISPDEAAQIAELRDAIAALLPDLPTDPQLQQAAAEIDRLKERTAALTEVVAARSARIKAAQELLAGLKWDQGAFVPDAAAPEPRVAAIREAVAALVATHSVLTDWARAHEFGDAALAALRDGASGQAAALAALNSEVRDAFAAFDQAANAAEKAIGDADLGPAQKAAYVERLKTALTTGDQGFDGLGARRDALDQVVDAARKLARSLTPLKRRLAAVVLKPDGALDPELAEIKALHDKIKLALGTELGA